MPGLSEVMSCFAQNFTRILFSANIIQSGATVGEGVSELQTRA